MSKKSEEKAQETYEYLIQRIERSENTHDIYQQFRQLKGFIEKEVQTNRVSEQWAEGKLSYVDSELQRLKKELGIKSTQFVSIDVADLQRQFEYVLPTMKAFLEGKGMILPFDASDMTELFFERAFSKGEQGRLNTLLRREDFIEFHKMVESKFNEMDIGKEIELSDVEIQAVDNVSRSAQNPEKREVLIEYLKQSKSRVKSDIKAEFMQRYGLSSSTFYNWTKALNDEIKSISRTEK